METLLEKIKECNKSLERNTSSLGLVETRINTYAEVCKKGYEQVRQVNEIEFKEVINYLREGGYLTEDEDNPENYMEALQVIENFYVEEQKDREKAETAIDNALEFVVESGWAMEKPKDLLDALDKARNCGYQEAWDNKYGDVEEVNHLKERIKELERMYDEAVAKKSKPATPRWITEIGSVFKSVMSKASREEWRSAYKLEDGTIAALDGFRIIKTSEPVDVVIAQHSDTMVQMFKNVLKDTSCCDKAHELPPLSVLKELDNEAKKTKACKSAKGIYLFEHEGVRYGFNIKYLMDGMKATHSEVIMLSKPNGIAIMESEDKKTFYLCLPVNVSQSGEKELDKVHY